MSFPFDEDSFVFHTAIPSQTNGFGTLGLLQTTHVELPRFRVVVVYGRNGRILLFKLLVGIEHQDWQMLEDEELQLGDVVLVDPIFCGLTDKVLLRAASGTVSLHRVTSCSNQVVEFGEVNYEGIVIVLEERFCFQAGCEGRTEDQMCLFVMLLNDLLEASVIQLSEFGEVMDVCNDVGEVGLEQIKVIFEVVVGFRVRSDLMLLPLDNVLDLGLGSFY